MGRVVAWLADATPDTPMPSGPDVPTMTLGEVLESSYAALEDWSEEVRHRNAPRTSPHPPSPAVVPHGPPLSAPGETPLVTVVMPVWNRASVLRRAVESVQAQTYPNWELIVVDDGSTDDTASILEGLAHVRRRICLITATTQVSPRPATQR